MNTFILRAVTGACCAAVGLTGGAILFTGSNDAAAENTATITAAPVAAPMETPDVMARDMNGLGAVFSAGLAEVAALNTDNDAISEPADRPELPDHDLGRNYQPTPCDTDLLDDIYGGLAVDVPVLVYPGEYFHAVTVKNGWDFRPAGIYYSGEIRIDPITCLRAGSTTNSPAWENVYAEAKALIVHETAHALDLDILDGISATIDFPVTNIGHAEKLQNGKAELFAFCAQASEGFDIRDRCPDGNRAAMQHILDMVNTRTVSA